jgi:hypothetical protein
MGWPESDSLDKPRSVPLEYIYGVYFGPDGGVSDNTVRPSQRPRRSPNGVSQPLPEIANGQISNGPDLLDWLARTFDD